MRVLGAWGAVVACGGVNMHERFTFPSAWTTF